jgi:Leucine-rich repeat (LRR) protein
MDDISLLIRRNKRGADPKLVLSHRFISTLPSPVTSLLHLEILDLSNNKISSLDASLQNLTKLKMLDVSSNSISVTFLTRLSTPF